MRAAMRQENEIVPQVCAVSIDFQLGFQFDPWLSGLKVFVQCKVARLLLLLGLVRFCVFANAFLKEIRFALQRNEVHEFEWIFDIEHRLTVQFAQQTIRNKFNVCAHISTIHAQHRHWQCHRQKFLFNFYRFDDDFAYTFRRRLLYNVLEHQTCKIAVHTFVT